MDVGDYASRTLAAMTAMEQRLKAEFKADMADMKAELKHDIQLVDTKVEMVADRVDQRMDQGFRQIVDCLTGHPAHPGVRPEHVQVAASALLLTMLADMEQAAAYAQQARPGSQAQRNHRGSVLYGLINILSAVHELLEDRLRASGVAVRKKSRFSWVVREAAAHRLVTDQEERDLFRWLTMRDQVAHLPTTRDVDAVLSAVPSFVGGVRRIVERTPR